MEENKKKLTENQGSQQTNKPDNDPKKAQEEGGGNEAQPKNPDHDNSNREGQGTKMPGRDTRTPVAGDKGESNSASL